MSGPTCRGCGGQRDAPAPWFVNVPRTYDALDRRCRWCAAHDAARERIPRYAARCRDCGRALLDADGRPTCRPCRAHADGLALAREQAAYLPEIPT